MQDLSAFVVAGFTLTGSPGPATLRLAATGAAFGARRGLRYMAGIIAGMVAVIGIVATGVTGAVLALPDSRPVLATLGAAYIVYLAYRIATAPSLRESADQRPGRHSSGAFLRLRLIQKVMQPW